MRIVQVCPYFHPHVGGVESHVMSLSEELVSRGHEVHVVTARLKGTKEKEKIGDIIIHRPKPLFIWMKTPVVPKIMRTIKELKGDVIHSHSPPPLPSYYAAKASQKAGSPFLITYHCDLEIPSRIGGFVTEMYRRTYGASTIKRADRVIATSNTYAATSRTVWNATPDVIPNMVDIERFNPGVDGSDIRDALKLRRDRGTVLFVGRLASHKGIEHLLEGAREVDANFLIVGGSESEEKYREMARKLDLGGKVFFAGTVTEKDLPKYYAASDILILPSVSRLEAFGIVALEAMATGKPVIISDIPGVREVITEGREGLLVDPLNPKDLAEKVSVLLGDEGKRREMGINARKKVEERFSLEKVVDTIERLYKSVAKT
jgi:N-acetyllactosaminide 3-alpha-galactosyltransferase